MSDITTALALASGDPALTLDLVSTVLDLVSERKGEAASSALAWDLRCLLTEILIDQIDGGYTPTH